MLSRIFWVGIAGVALVTGMMLQDGNWFFGSDDRVVDVGIDRAVDRTVDRVTDRVVDSSVHRMQVVGADGKAIEVSPQDKRALADAIARLVEAETSLAVLKIGDGGGEELQAAQARRDQARTEVETLKSEIERQRQAMRGDQDAVREQVRAEIRESIRDVVRN